MTNQQFDEGATVYDAGDEKIGTLREHNRQAGYILVEKGWLIPTDLYIPTDAVRSTSADGTGTGAGTVHLSLHKNDLQAEQYANPPASGAAVAWDEQRAMTTQTQTIGADEDLVVTVHEEELVVGTREQETGRVHIHKDVVTEQQSVTVPLEQERVTVERAAIAIAEQDDVDLAGAFQERDIDIPVMGEVAVVSKEVRATEEVRLRKDVVTEHQQVSDTVRKERVTVDGAVDGTDDATMG